jgi:ABC-type cobalt transport system substrate-binding protein
MKIKIAVCSLLLVVLAFGAPAAVAGYVGADEAVVGKFAASAGRKPAPPIMDADSGELGRLLWLMAGVAGGFALGYCFRSLSHKGKGEGFRRDV